MTRVLEGVRVGDKVAVTRKIAQAEAVEARRVERERDRRCRELRNDIRYHLERFVPEDVLRRALDVLTGKDGA